ncbi:two-component regulator propeller domain-containing protein [Pedobacter frigoris]|uniref:ligand-binding sensor domain-containing protein n=1 Tax=Pedobacter frigoris TaxID=2571272 RepID=UPI0029310839|nr:two-component regulator propeller domain-containing protein [Pedobacter frigoris]
MLSAYNPAAYPQRYNFEQFDIDKGLTQSQVTSFAQDSHRRLWIATLGGISCFNGSEFTSYTKTNGLSSNFTLTLAVGKQNNLWIGSARGTTTYNGLQFSNYGDHKKWVNRLVVDKTGSTYALKSKHLFKITGQKEQAVSITRDKMEFVTALNLDQSGKIWAAIHQKGIYSLENNIWVLRSRDSLTFRKLFITDILVDKFNLHKVWLVTSDGIYILNNNVLKKAYPEITLKCMSIAQDDKGAVWIGTSKGAYCITSTQVIHFNSKNGFTDNMVNTIFKDIENNIWLGTDGSGIFKFTNNTYVTFDETQGIQNKIVMAISNGPEPGTIWLGSFGGLYEYKQNQKIKSITIPTNNEDAYRINFLYKDSKKNVWIGTPGAGLWMHNGKQIIKVDEKYHDIAYNAILEDTDGKIWLSTDYGCLLYNPINHDFKKITRQFGGGLLEMGKDSIITGTQDGVWLINKQKASHLDIKGLEGSSILSMLKYKEYVLFGTADYGLMIWNSKTGSSKIINTKSGLASDHVYSILKDTKGIIWLGTGRGVNRLNPKDFKLIPNVNNDNILVECNQNAILQNGDNIWIGTTKGAIVFPVNSSSSTKVKPYIYINSVSISPSYKRDSSKKLKTFFKDYELEYAPALPYDHNHININYTGIYLSSPNAISYKYRLLGLDNKFNLAGTNTSINFTALPPGKYRFEVIALTREGISSENAANFSFEILPPYYQTGLFRFFMLLIVILSILLAVYIILKLNERKRKFRLKIKLEEQFKIRKQTAEDFHDDLGNKLTRITVLSEVLSSMIDKNDTEKRGILKKISNNVDELYTGTKDILWALNPKNDTLSQLLNHIRSFGEEMFNETPIEFRSNININNRDSRLSLDISRNILLIFKESIHNVLKHARATEITFSAVLNNEILTLSIVDNGQGFDIEHAKNGHGINNLYVRAKRINANLNITSGTQGTSISIMINFPTLKHFKNV